VERQYRDGSNLNARIALHEHFSTNAYGWTRWMFDQVELPPDGRVLEIGCGTGKLWADNLNRIPNGWDVTLTDASPGMLREAENNLESAQRLRFRVADARELPFEDGCFDAVVINFVLHHVPERWRAISEAARGLKQGGTFYAATSGRRHLREMNRMMQVLDPSHHDDGLADRISNFSLETGAEQLSAHFPEISIRHYEDALVVTEAKPLVDYALSAMTVQEATARLPVAELRARVSRLTSDLDRELASQGEIRISKHTGMFLARR
jgi:ubiquinone/menaquinone biosynthesis C-methylase UbiE